MVGGGAHEGDYELRPSRPMPRMRRPARNGSHAGTSRRSKAFSKQTQGLKTNIPTNAALFRPLGGTTEQGSSVAPISLSTFNIKRPGRPGREADDARIVAMLAATTAHKARVQSAENPAVRTYSPLRASAVGKSTTSPFGASSGRAAAKRRPSLGRRIVQRISSEYDRRALSARGDYSSSSSSLSASSCNAAEAGGEAKDISCAGDAVAKRLKKIKIRPKKSQAAASNKKDMQVPKLNMDAVRKAGGRISPLVSPESQSTKKNNNPFSFEASKIKKRVSPPTSSKPADEPKHPANNNSVSAVRPSEPSTSSHCYIHRFPLWERKGGRQRQHKEMQPNHATDGGTADMNGNTVTPEDRLLRQNTKQREKGGALTSNIHSIAMDEIQREDSLGSAPPPFEWQKGEMIGKGTYGTVYMGLNEMSGELFAAKEIFMGNFGDSAASQRLRAKKFVEEIQVMQALVHPHIVRYLGVQRCENNNAFFIFLEYVPGGSLSSMLKQFGALKEKLVAKYATQILSGMAYLHGKGIIHRDIKGANVLVNEVGVIKLADFGCSKQLQGMVTTSLDNSLKALRGSIPWMAPEVVKQSGHGRKADVWSFGATIIEMATANHPWPHLTGNLQALFTIATCNEPPPIPEHLSSTAVAFLSHCFRIDPAHRWSALQLQHHNWISTSTSPARLLRERAAKETARTSPIILQTKKLHTSAEF